MLCAETVKFPARLSTGSPVDMEKSSYVDLHGNGHDVVTGIRWVSAA